MEHKQTTFRAQKGQVRPLEFVEKDFTSSYKWWGVLKW